MKIIFIRHGQPEFNTRLWLGNGDVSIFIQKYCDARVTEVHSKTKPILEAAAGSYVLVSELVRAQDSARLCMDSEPEVSELLNEAELPHPDRLLIPLPWPVLLLICRLGWLIGYRSNAPGIGHDLIRAKQASTLLVDRASKHINVYAFGHGVMSYLIVRELKKKGWKEISSTGRGYWSKTIVSLV